VKRQQRVHLSWFLPVLVLFAAPPASADVHVFSTGSYGTPETVSTVPVWFGSLGGNYFIPDARVANIWITPATGGPPTSFLASPISGGVRGGIFLPLEWGDLNSGDFVTAGLNVNVYDSLGFKESFLFLDQISGLPVVATANFSTPLVAPAAFGTYGGHLFVSDQNNQVWEMAPATQILNLFLNSRQACPAIQQNDSCPFWNLSPFGIEFSPAGWGSFGNLLLISGAGPVAHDDGTPFLDGNGSRYSEIVGIAPDGTPSVFANIPLRGAASDPDTQQQNGLRQILMLPDDFLVPSLGAAGAGKLLLVSVSGSGQGGGVLGETLAVDSTGQIQGHLVTGSVLAKYDPRGMVITSDNQLLVSDTSDPIVQASPSDFAPGRGAVCSVISSVASSSLWPPNHKLVSAGLAATSSCPAPLAIAVYSNEGDTDDTGDGNFSPDAKGSTPADLTLRAERDASGAGRVYLIVVTSTDIAGTVAPSCNTVTVPLSQSAADVSNVQSKAAAAGTFCQQNAGAAPAGFVQVGNGPVIGSKQ